MESTQQHGLIRDALDLGKSVVTSLPPAFLLLILINIAFLGLVMWFLNAQASERTLFVTKLMDRCMEIALHAPSPDGH